MTTRAPRPDPMAIAAGEQGVIRVFALSADSATARLIGPDPDALFGRRDLDPDGLEMVDIADLGDLGLPGYLAEGHEVPFEEMEPDLPRLSALMGFVVLLRAEAAGPKGADLRPIPQLAPVGAYRQAQGDPARVWPTPEPEATVPLAPPTPTPRPPAQGGAALLILSLALLLAIVLWLAL